MSDNLDEFMKASAEEWSKPEGVQEAADDIAKAAEEVSDAAAGETIEEAVGEVLEPEVFESQADDFMKASAEEWSKEELPAAEEIVDETPKDRWGAPEASVADENPDRWGSEKLEEEPKIIEATPTKGETETKKPFPWWGIVLIILGVLCMCIPLTVLIIVLAIVK